MICSGLCLFRFIMSLLAQFLGSRDSQNDWIKFRGAGHNFSPPFVIRNW